MSTHPADRLAAAQADRRLRKGLLLGLVAVLLVILLVVVLRSATRLGQSDVYVAVSATAYELEQTPVEGLGLSSFDIQEAASMANRSGGGRYSRDVVSQLRMESVGRDDRGDLYEFTNSDGDHPVCLAVRVEIYLAGTSPSFPSTSVSNGRC